YSYGTRILSSEGTFENVGGDGDVFGCVVRKRVGELMPTDFASRPRRRDRRGLSRWLAVSRLSPSEILHELVHALLHFLRREIFLARRDRPLVAMRVGEGSGTIAPELIRHLAHWSGRHLRTGCDGAIEQRVAIL